MTKYKCQYQRSLFSICTLRAIKRIVLQFLQRHYCKVGHYLTFQHCQKVILQVALVFNQFHSKQMSNNILVYLLLDFLKQQIGEFSHAYIITISHTLVTSVKTSHVVLKI